MRVLLLGATGSIGAPVLRELLDRGHDIIALARSDGAAATLERTGAAVLRGDIGNPQAWVPTLPDVDGVIHMACDFGSDMAASDRHLLDALLPRLAAQAKRARFVYTGGCWLFGATGDAVATEERPFSPLPAFDWMVPHLQRILDSPAVAGLVVHPAMVYGGEGGVFRRFAREAAQGAIRIVGERIRPVAAGPLRRSRGTLCPRSRKAPRQGRAISLRPSRAFPSGGWPGRFAPARR